MCLLLSEAFVREAKHLWEFSRKSRQEDICLSFFGPIPLVSPAQQTSLTRRRVYHEIKIRWVTECVEKMFFKLSIFTQNKNIVLQKSNLVIYLFFCRLRSVFPSFNPANKCMNQSRKVWHYITQQDQQQWLTSLISVPPESKGCLTNNTNYKKKTTQGQSVANQLVSTVILK